MLTIWYYDISHSHGKETNAISQVDMFLFEQPPDYSKKLIALTFVVNEPALL